ncbi:MAG TPA: hypothetical protein VHV08_09880 [Pirellulales bacterium]|nr:hypothetical protein [Pirellulales bacterium]
MLSFAAATRPHPKPPRGSTLMLSDRRPVARRSLSTAETATDHNCLV